MKRDAASQETAEAIAARLERHPDSCAVWMKRVHDVMGTTYKQMIEMFFADAEAGKALKARYDKMDTFSTRVIQIARYAQVAPESLAQGKNHAVRVAAQIGISCTMVYKDLKTLGLTWDDFKGEMPYEERLRQLVAKSVKTGPLLDELLAAEQAVN